MTNAYNQMMVHVDGMNEENQNMMIDYGKLKEEI